MKLGILRDVVERHADEAAFVWSQRQRGSQSPVFDLTTLREWDERLAANLEGLLIAEAVGLESCLKALEGGAAGRLFAATYVAASCGDTMAFAKLVVAAEERRSAQREVVSALTWLPAALAQQVLGEMTDARAPAPLQVIAIEAIGERGDDGYAAAIARGLASDDVELEGAAAFAAGRLADTSALPALKELYSGDDEELALTAACAATLMGDKLALEALWEMLLNTEASESLREDQRMRDALRYACATADEFTAGKVTSLVAEPGKQTWALAAAAALGDPASVPLVLQLMGDERLSRLAAWAYASVTGLALAPPYAVRAATNDPTREQVARRAIDAFEDVAAPNKDEISEHWQQVGSLFEVGKRYRAGMPLSEEHLMDTLRAGKQPWRHDSALTLARMGKVTPLVSTSAPAWRQDERLAGLADDA